MTAEEIVRHHRREPFQPFRIQTTTGKTYRIIEPAWLTVTRYDITLGLDPDESGIPTRSVYIDNDHIVELEPIREDLKTPREPGEA